MSVRQGFWLKVGVAGSVRSVDCKPLCSRDPGQGAALTLALGGTVSPRLLLGGEIPAWAPWNSPYVDHGHVGLLFTARYYVLKMTSHAVASTAKQGKCMERSRPNDVTDAYA